MVCDKVGKKMCVCVSVEEEGGGGGGAEGIQNQKQEPHKTMWEMIP